MLPVDQRAAMHPGTSLSPISLRSRLQDQDPWSRDSSLSCYNINYNNRLDRYKKEEEKIALIAAIRVTCSIPSVRHHARVVPYPAVAPSLHQRCALVVAHRPRPAKVAATFASPESRVHAPPNFPPNYAVVPVHTLRRCCRLYRVPSVAHIHTEDTPCPADRIPLAPGPGLTM